LFPRNLKFNLLKRVTQLAYAVAVATGMTEVSRKCPTQWATQWTRTRGLIDWKMSDGSWKPAFLEATSRDCSQNIHAHIEVWMPDGDTGQIRLRHKFDDEFRGRCAEPGSRTRQDDWLFSGMRHLVCNRLMTNSEKHLQTLELLVKNLPLESGNLAFLCARSAALLMYVFHTRRVDLHARIDKRFYTQAIFGPFYDTMGDLVADTIPGYVMDMPLFKRHVWIPVLEQFLAAGRSVKALAPLGSIYNLVYDSKKNVVNETMLSFLLEEGVLNIVSGMDERLVALSRTCLAREFEPKRVWLEEDCWKDNSQWSRHMTKLVLNYLPWYCPLRFWRPTSTPTA
jgi:hypothetical protein